MIYPENNSNEFKDQNEDSQDDQNNPTEMNNQNEDSQDDELNFLISKSIPSLHRRSQIYNFENPENKEIIENSEAIGDINENTYETKECSKRRKIALFGDPTSESYRLKTFHKFPHFVPIDPNVLAACGFLYTGHRDRVACFSCHKDVENWKDGADPRSEIYHNPECEIIFGVKQSNMAIPSRQNRNSPTLLQLKCLESTDSSNQSLSLCANASDSGYTSARMAKMLFGKSDSYPPISNLFTEGTSRPHEINENPTHIIKSQNQVKNQGFKLQYEPETRAKPIRKKYLYGTKSNQETSNSHTQSIKLSEESLSGSTQRSEKSILERSSYESSPLDFNRNSSLKHEQFETVNSCKTVIGYHSCRGNSKAFLNSPISSGGECSDEENQQTMAYNFNLFANTKGLSKSLKDYYRRDLDLTKEDDRLKTFECWNSIPTKITPKMLSRSGFFYVKRSMVKCISCGYDVVYWNEEDDEASLMKLHLPNCIMVSPSFWKKRIIAAYTHSNQIPSCESFNGIFPTLLIHCRDPINPYMRNFHDRLATFDKNWPQRLVKFDAEKIAQAGFFYLGFNDHVKCYYCNGKLQNLNQVNGDFCDEHGKRFPWCEFKTILQKESEQSDLGNNNTKKHRTLLNDKNTKNSFVIETKQVEEFETPATLLSPSTAPTNASVGQTIHDVSASSTSTFSSITTALNNSSSRNSRGQCTIADLHGGEIDERMCRWCLGERANVVVFPCKHLVICTKCEPKVVNCPVCNEVKQSTLCINLL